VYVGFLLLLLLLLLLFFIIREENIEYILKRGKERKGNVGNVRNLAPKTAKCLHE